MILKYSIHTSVVTDTHTPQNSRFIFAGAVPEHNGHLHNLCTHSIILALTKDVQINIKQNYNKNDSV